MNELKQQLIEKLGLDAGVSEEAIKMVLSFVKDKLPENMQGMVDSIMNGQTPDLGGAVDALKGLFGK